MFLLQFRSMVKNKKMPLRKLHLVAIILIAALLLGGFMFYKTQKQENTTSSPPISADTKGNDVNFNPPSEAEISDTEQHKKELANDTLPSTGNTTDGRKVVSPVISYVDKTTVNAYVTGIFEEGGTCTATLTKGSKTITKTSTGFQNASYTQCAPMDLTGSSIESGDWSVVVSYSSSTASGKSETLVKKL